nr:MAG: hypothetical protein [Mononegavirales sp.]
MAVAGIEVDQVLNDQVCLDLQRYCRDPIDTQFEVINQGLPTIFPLVRDVIDYLRSTVANVRLVFVPLLEEGQLANSVATFYDRYRVSPDGSVLVPSLGTHLNHGTVTYLLSRCSGPTFVSLANLPRPAGATTTSFPDRAIEAVDHTRIHEAGPDPSKREEVFFVYGSYQETTMILGTNGFPPMAKLCTAAFYFFHYARENIRSIAIEVSMAEFLKIYPNVPLRPLPATDSQVMQMFQVGVAYGLMSCQYSQATKLNEQLYRRYKAGCASYGLNMMSEPEFRTSAGQMNRTRVEANPIGLQVMGYCLAIDREFNYNINATNLSLASVTEMTRHWNLPQYASAMLEQSRLVYSFSQHTTLKFGFAIIDMVEAWFRGIGGAFLADLEAAIAAREEIGSSPYCGLVRTIPERHQVKRIARIAEVGVLYQGRLAATTTHANEWSHYNLDSVSKHVDSQGDVSLCTTIAGMLPLGKIVSIGMMVPHMSAKEVQVKLDDKPEVRADAFAQYIKNKHPQCDWMLDYTRRRRLELLDDLERTRLAQVISIVKDQVNRLRRGLDANMERNELREAELTIESEGGRIIGALNTAFTNVRDALQAADLVDHPELQNLANLMSNITRNIAVCNIETFRNVMDGPQAAGQGANQAPQPGDQ